MDIPQIKALLFMKHNSERVPFKNMRDFCGRPLFHWIVDALKKSRYISEIIINTDSDQIAESALDSFDVTIHMRPDYLLTITSNEANAIMEYDLSVTEGEYFFQTHSTNPLLKTETIDKSIEFFFRHQEHDSLFSVCPIQTRLFFADGSPINHDPSKLVKTQDLPIVYEENSCIYIFSREGFHKAENRIGSNPVMFPTEKLESVDIDEMEDFYYAEFLMNKRTKNEA